MPHTGDVTRRSDLRALLSALVAPEDLDLLLDSGVAISELARPGLQGAASLLPLRLDTRRRLAAAFELARLRNRESPPERLEIADAQDAFEVVWPHLCDEPVEVFRLLVLDARNRLVAMPEISRGTLSTSLVHPREVYRPAVLAGAAAVIVAHNHPSGVSEPSTQDHAVTARLARAGQIMGIPLLDHLIVGERSYHSYRECGDPLLRPTTP